MRTTFSIFLTLWRYCNVSHFYNEKFIQLFESTFKLSFTRQQIASIQALISSINFILFNIQQTFSMTAAVMAADANYDPGEFDNPIFSSK